MKDSIVFFYLLVFIYMLYLSFWPSVATLMMKMSTLNSVWWCNIIGFFLLLFLLFTSDLTHTSVFLTTLFINFMYMYIFILSHIISVISVYFNMLILSKTFILEAVLSETVFYQTSDIGYRSFIVLTGVFLRPDDFSLLLTDVVLRLNFSYDDWDLIYSWGYHNMNTITTPYFRPLSKDTPPEDMEAHCLTLLTAS